MRTLTDTLLAAQQAGFVDALVKIELTLGASSYTYAKPQILNIKETGDGSFQTITITLDNSDKSLTDLDLRGYEGVLSYGAITANEDSPEEYSALAPMTVRYQEFDSDPKKLECTLTLIGICNDMAEDEASEAYQPDEDDVLSVKEITDAIAGATLTCFDHCKAYEVEWDAGYDNLADTYIPKDAFRIYAGNNRNSAIDRLLDYTLNVKVVKADGKIHIFKPTTTGVVYDSEYSLESGHPFFAKALRNRLVTPNYVTVCSREDDDPQYGGYAIDHDSYDILPKAHFKRTRLASDAQGTAIAEAILAQAVMWCEAGAASVPLNTGTEAFDYIKVTDSREGDYRVGNIGRYTRYYDVRKNRWELAFNFGNWQNARKALDNLNIKPDDLENYFSRLSVGTLYAEHILAENCDFVWIDPDNTIDLSKIGDNLDNLPDGEVYARVKTLHLDAGIIKLDENILYKEGYDPSTKWTGEDLDDLPDGTVYQRVKSAALTAGGLVILDEVIAGTYGLVKSTDISAGHIRLQYCVGDLDDIDDGGTYEKVKATDISAGHVKLSACSGDLDDIDNGSTYAKLRTTDIDSGHIKLSSYTKVSGEWYDEAGVEIDANNGINIYGKNNALTTRGTKTGTIQCYVGSDGSIRAGGGDVILDSNGIHITGQHLDFKLAGSVRGQLYVGASHVIINATSGWGVSLNGDNIVMNADYVDMHSADFMVLPMKTFPPSDGDGRLVYDSSDGHLKYYSAHDSQWFRVQRTGGWG